MRRRRSQLLFGVLWPTVWLLAACWLLTGQASARAGQTAADTTAYVDALTGLTFSQYVAQYSLDKTRGIHFRIAVPAAVAASEPFDVVLQVVAPADVGWAGLAWGGSMTRNPLAVAWATSSGALLSSRWASGHYLPQPYSNASYEILRAGTRRNATHWQVTARCRGCTEYGPSTKRWRLAPHGSNRLAFAYAAKTPATPASNLSDFSEHSVIGFWNHDFGTGANAGFSRLVAHLERV